MSRRSRSPRRNLEDGPNFHRGGYDSRREKSRERDSGYKNRYRDQDLPERHRERGYKSSQRDEERRPERDPREYDERKRERDRERDRERYDNGRDRDRDYTLSRGQRRSASPRSHETGPRETGSHSGSPAVQSPSDKSKPNFAPSGLLAAETNTVKAIDGTSTVLKYNEPPEARKPAMGWRLYVFKDAEQVELLHIQRQSAYLVGRDRLVADIAIDHPSCSKQHAVFQYRYVQEKDEFGGSKGVVKPFIIDLESTNGTMVNDETIPAARYYELKAGDVVKFGLSTREYVLLHDEVS
ncbi:hypothetical protein GALMADRAFT_238135 [Galerina marginata CBS 339.88]|uniref:FHA domain-containing protein n=1 Tax=Galerina marginata (strain CBS 339.88) TaxID=685588 RepID=A0A067TJZ7_GALM3|nr:hypothetical protein GALMADRAFT_238135 [Galerina marginata CBS 339.88]